MTQASNWQERYADRLLAVGGVLLCVFLFLLQGGVITWWLVLIGGSGVLLLGAGFSLKSAWPRWRKARRKSGDG
jgi:hypothetical protein